MWQVFYAYEKTKAFRLSAITVKKIIVYAEECGLFEVGNDEGFLNFQLRPSKLDKHSCSSPLSAAFRDPPSGKG